MSSLTNHSFNRRHRKSDVAGSRRADRRRRILLERLEDRCLLAGLTFENAAMFGGAGDQAGIGVSSIGGDVYVSGTSDVNAGDGLVARFSSALAPDWSNG